MEKNNERINEAFNTIKECVDEVLAIDDLKLDIQTNEKHHKNRMLTIISWFNFLKKEAIDSEEYKKSKELILSIGKKHPSLNEWCNDFVEKPLPTYETIEINVSNNEKYNLKDDLQVVFDLNEVKKYIDVESINDKTLNFKIIYKDREYAGHHYFKDYIPKTDVDEECPYRASIINAKMDNNRNCIVEIHVMTWQLIEK